jgi:hypothetical protein
MGGFIFYNHNSHMPLQNQPANPGQPVATEPSEQTAPSEKILISEETPVTDPDSTANASAVAAAPATTQVLGQTTCDTTAQEQAVKIRDSTLQAEDQRFEQLMNKRRGVKQLLAVITGNITNPPSPDELQKHETLQQQINDTYQQALSTAHCT